jgi:hypothetical protein
MPEDPHGPIVQGAITSQQMMKRLIWDVAPCPVASEVAKKVGLSPASPDVEEMEHTEAHFRLAIVERALGPMLTMMSGMSVRAALEATEVAHGEEARTDPESASYLHALVYQAILGILAELQDVGAIAINMRIGYEQ